MTAEELDKAAEEYAKSYVSEGAGGLSEKMEVYANFVKIGYKAGWFEAKGESVHTDNSEVIANLQRELKHYKCKGRYETFGKIGFTVPCYSVRDCNKCEKFLEETK